MHLFLKLSLLNVTRNTRRSIMTCLVITLGLTFMFAARGLLNGLQSEIHARITRGMHGDIQITKMGYANALPAKSLDYLFIATPDLLEKIKKIDGVEAVTERLIFGGVINHYKSQSTTPFVGMGLDPENELLVSPRMPGMIDAGNGEFLKPNLEHDAVLGVTNIEDVEEADVDEDIDFSKPVNKTSAQDLVTNKGEFHQIIIGRAMREAFKYKNKPASLNDELVLLAQGRKSSQRSIVGTLTGVIEVPDPTAGKLTVLLDLKTAQNLVNEPGQVTQLIMTVKEGYDLIPIKSQLNQILSPYELEARTWDEVQKFFAMVMELQNVVFSIVMFVIILIVIVAIVITSMMTVSERINEIGTLMAIGYRRNHLLTMFLMESSFIGLVGGFFGLVLGLAIIGVLHEVGIPFTIPGTLVPITIRPTATLAFSVSVVITGWVASVIASLYPTYKGSRMRPLEALGKN